MKNLKGVVYDIIRESKDGKTANELYQQIPDFAPRSVRYSLQELINAKMVEKTHCRCGTAPIYIVNLSSSKKR